MPEKIPPNAGECQHVSYHHPKWQDNGTCYWDGITTQHQSLHAKAKCILPPTKIIPAIFLPGIMGSNLKSSGGEVKAGESIWRGDNLLNIYGKWATMTGHERRNLLNPGTTVVDERGEVSANIYSLITDDGKGAYGSLLPARQAGGWGRYDILAMVIH